MASLIAQAYISSHNTSNNVFIPLFRKRKSLSTIKSKDHWVLTKRYPISLPFVFFSTNQFKIAFPITNEWLKPRKDGCHLLEGSKLTIS